MPTSAFKVALRVTRACLASRYTLFRARPAILVRLSLTAGDDARELVAEQLMKRVGR